MLRVLLFLLSATSMAQAVRAESFDATFNGSGRLVVTTSVDGQQAIALLELPDGKLARVSSGSVTCGSPLCVSIGILQADGSSSAFPFVYNTGLPFASIEAAVVDSLGRVIVVGSSPSGAQGRDFRVLRTTPSGGYDSSFGSGGVATVDFFGFDDYALAVVVDRDDNIVVAGSASLGSGDTDFAIARLRSSNGSLDTNFATSSKTTVAFDLAGTQRFDEAKAVAITNNNRILLGGMAFDAAISRYRGAVARLNPNGSLDSTLCPGGCSYSSNYASLGNGRTAYYFGDFNAHSDIIRGVDAGGDGAFYVAGESYQPDGSARRAAVARFQSNGTYVAESLGDGLGGNASFRSVRISDGLGSRVIAAGESGPAGEFLFLQAFSPPMTPLANYGNCVPSNSVLCFAGSNGFGDAGPDRAGSLHLDRSGRPLLAASFVATSGESRALLFARFTNGSGPKPDLIFRNGFQ